MGYHNIILKGSKSETLAKQSRKYNVKIEENTKQNTKQDNYYAEVTTFKRSNEKSILA